MATGCVVLLNGAAVMDVAATLGTAAPTSRDITLKANPVLTKSASGYRLRIIAGSRSVDVPPDVFVMDVVLSERQPQLTPVPPPVPSVGPANVDTVRLPSQGRTGKEIVFWGRDFVPDRFVATIGSTMLAITSRSTTEIRAILPSQRMTAALVVSHGTENSKVQLRPSFEVYGHPTITSVVPVSFSRGSWVDIWGSDLNRAQPITYATSSHNPWVMIEDTPDNIGGDTLILVESWTAAADGRSARFRAQRSLRPRRHHVERKAASL